MVALSLNAQRQAAERFVQKWQGAEGYEKGEDSIFWTELLHDVYGVTDVSQFVEFQKPVELERGKDGKKTRWGYIDTYIPSTRVLIEQKSATKKLDAKKGQSDDSLLTPFEQAQRYSNRLPLSQHAKWIITCNFRQFQLYWMEKPNDPPIEFSLSDLADPRYFTLLNLLVEDRNERPRIEEEISIEAGEIVGKLYDGLLAQYEDRDNPSAETYRSLNILCVRLVFCLYAEDVELFEEHQRFHRYIQSFRPAQVNGALQRLFDVLDTPIEDREKYLDPELAGFPYVNGGLFSKDIKIAIPLFTEELVHLLMDEASAGIDWSKIDPTIFGAVFESTLNAETRRQGGMHYTSVENIRKVICPLFLDALWEEFDQLKRDQKASTRKRIANLKQFQQKLGSLTFLDPACGSGNFLTQTYLELRRLENEVLRITERGQVSFGFTVKDLIKVSISQFYGIEINDFAVSVAQTALWIAESQMFRKTADIVQVVDDFLPLKSYPNIVEGNALRMDWNTLVPKEKLDYIMGNPPFIGYAYQSKAQKEDLQQIYAQAKNIDYVAGWYFKSAELMRGNTIRAALVSTNSISQGEQVEAVWKPLMEQYGVHIDFAWRPFIWDSDTRDKAHVHCVIIGFSCGEPYREKTIFDGNSHTMVAHINPYLVDAPDIFITKHQKPLSDVSLMNKGNQPTDDGNFYLTEAEREEVLMWEPEIRPYIRRICGSAEFINNKKRFCLWLYGVSPAIINKSRFITNRIKKVKEFRLNSTKKATVLSAQKPALFQEIRQPNTEYLLIPRVSSERRNYLPVGFLKPEVIVNDSVLIVPNATLYELGIITSSVHMAWMRAVAGRLKSDYRYSNTIVYNNFIWPDVTEEQKDCIAETAQGILDARNKYPDSSLADLYDVLTMPPDLLKAHQANDRVVMAAYGFPVDMTEPEIVAELMKRYQAKLAEAKG
ncbi:MAG: class I SAM-dependent DNA methyltransferase [Oxalobacter sp.]|nr:class I SAM-dependent DNA methyltransferase [Oxalobacter sp.]